MVDILEYMDIETRRKKADEIPDPILKEESENIKMEIVNIGENMADGQLTTNEYNCVNILHDIAVREMNLKEKVDWDYIRQSMKDICMAKRKGHEPAMETNDLRFALKAGKSYGIKNSPQYTNKSLVEARSLLLARQQNVDDKKAFYEQFEKGRQIGSMQRWGTYKIKDPKTYWRKYHGD